MSAIVLAVFNDSLREALEGAITTITNNIEAANSSPSVG